MSATVSLVKELPILSPGMTVEYVGEDVFAFPVGMVGTVRADDRRMVAFPVLVEFHGTYANGKPRPPMVLAFDREEVRLYR
jgi:hypothetical protein